MRSKRSMTHNYLVTMILVATFPVMILGYFWVSQQLQLFDNSSSLRRANYIASEKEDVQLYVNEISSFINYQQRMVEDNTNAQLRENAVGIFRLMFLMGTLLEEFRELTPQQKLQSILHSLSKVQLSGNRNSYALYDDQLNLLQTTQFDELYGSALLSDGHTVSQKVQTLLHEAIDKEEAYISYQYLPEGLSESGALDTKRLYARYSKDLGLIVVVGRPPVATLEVMQRETLRVINNLVENGRGVMLFVADLDGELLTAGSRSVEKVNPLIEKIDGEEFQSLFEHHLKVSLNEGGGFVDVDWISANSDSPSGVNYVLSVPEWGWILGAGFSMNQLEVQLADERQQLLSELRFSLIFIAIIVSLILFAALLAVRWFHRKSASGFDQFTHFFLQASDQSGEIDLEKLPYTEFVELAGSANKMVQERSKYERALLHSEQRFQLALDYSNQFLCEINLATKQVKIDQKFYDSLGHKYLTKENTYLDDILKITYPKDKKIVENVINRDDFQVGEVSIRLLDAENNWRWFMFKSDIFSLEGEDVNHLLGTVVEITENKKIEVEILEAKRKALDANYVKNLFLASMNHELRTPLNGVLGYARLLLRDERLSADQRKYLLSIESCGENLLSLIADVLELSALDSDSVEINEEQIELGQFLNEINLIIRTKASLKGLKYQCVIDERVPALVAIDVMKLKQILVNLLVNAVKFTKRGEVKLEVDIESDEQLLFKVYDSGLGISQHDIRDIFEPFKQVSEGHVEGAGLGLAICKRLISAMGGNISVDSELGVGSCFAIRLPLKVDIDDQEGIVSTVGVVPGSSDNNVLLITLNHKLSNVVKSGLANSEFNWQVMNSRSELLQPEEETSGVRLLDINISESEAIDIIAQCRSSKELQQFIIIALVSGEVEETQLIRAGCDQLLKAPFEFERILVSLANYLYISEKSFLPFSGETVLNSSMPEIELSKDESVLLHNALRVGDIQQLRSFLVNRIKAGTSPEDRAWFNHCLELLEQFDLDALTAQLDQLIDPEVAT